MDKLSINGVDYVRPDDAPPPPPVRIVILQRGWVMVGRYYQDGTDVTLTNAHVIRRWGTSSGLGEIAAGGPTKDTVLDPAGVVRFHELVVIAALDCDAERWPQC